MNVGSLHTFVPVEDPPSDVAYAAGPARHGGSITPMCLDGRMRTASPFLSIPEEIWLAANDLTFAFYDANPTSPGHTLIVPRRAVASWFHAWPGEQAAALSLLGSVKRVLDSRFRPDGYNVGFNDGAAAGQTVFHAHLHVIPRYTNDVIDPRGGIRHAVIGRGYYDG
jgi:diadenosine tetraphosphate (Ap4A) HIT family hydrolase